MIAAIPIPITRHSLVVDRQLLATAERDKMLTAARQPFDELGMKVHKQNSFDGMKQIGAACEDDEGR